MCRRSRRRENNWREQDKGRGAGGRGGSRGADDKQEVQPAGDTTVRGLNIAGELRAGRAGASAVRAMSDGAQSVATGGAGGTRGVGRRGTSEAKSSRRAPLGSRRGKGRSEDP